MCWKVVMGDGVVCCWTVKRWVRRRERILRRYIRKNANRRGTWDKGKLHGMRDISDLLDAMRDDW